jgi:hypothetical protein
VHLPQTTSTPDHHSRRFPEVHMSATSTLPAPVTTTDVPAGEIDSRTAYTGFGAAYVLGHGASALSTGDSPLVALPGWLPMALLGTGLAVGTAAATVASVRSQRGAGGADALAARLVGTAWLTGMAALFLAITGLTGTHAAPELQSVLWPAGSGLVVGLLYLGEGAVRRNVLHYGLGTWLALTSTAALLLPAPGFFWVLALAGGGGFALAAVLEERRLVATRG